MKANRHNRGSVLMEFIIVFPIYLVLLGGVFMIGDMAIKTTRLAEADRTRAFDLEATNEGDRTISDGWNQIRDLLFPVTVINEDDVHEENYRHYADPEFRGPWTVAVGAKVCNEYKLAPWTRGWLAYPNWFFATATKTAQADGDFGALLADSRVQMFAKDINGTMYYNYYTYRRARIYADDQLARLYRAMPANLAAAGHLVDGSADSDTTSWKVMVNEDQPSIGDGKTGNNWNDSIPTLSNREYHRYNQFKTWSE